MVMKTNRFNSEKIIEILKKKELRKPLSKVSVLENLEIAEEAKHSGAESLYYREEINESELKTRLKRILSLI